MSKFFIIYALLCVVPIYCDPTTDDGITANWVIVASAKGATYDGNCSARLNLTKTDENCNGNEDTSIFTVEGEGSVIEEKAPIVVFNTEAELRTALTGTYNCSKPQDPNTVFYVKQIETGYGLLLAAVGTDKELIIVALDTPTKAKVLELIEKVKPFEFVIENPADLKWAVACSKD